MINNFTPVGATVAVSVSGTTASGALTALGANAVGKSVRVFNALAETVFIAFGGSTVEAATTDMPIPAGGVEVFDVGPKATHIAGITASGTGTLYATTGTGS